MKVKSLSLSQYNDIVSVHSASLQRADNEVLPSLSACVGALRPQTRRVLSLLIEGHSNKEIAWRLSLRESTVKWHISNITKALGCRNRTQAALIAFCVARNLSSEAAKLKAIVGSE